MNVCMYVSMYLSINVYVFSTFFFQLYDEDPTGYGDLGSTGSDGVRES